MKLELTFNTEYVLWTVEQAIRELLQNWQDAKTRGFDGKCKYSARKNRLRLVNKGCTLSRKDLILGMTSKRGDETQIGQFGSGMKDAFGVLLRQGLGLYIRSGDERWVPTIGRSENFDNAELICVDTHKVQFTNEVFIEVQGITPEVWQNVQDQTLFLSPPQKLIQCRQGQILMDAKHQGCLYSGGLFVMKLGEYRWGYNFPKLELDRDRRLAHPYETQYKVATMLEQAFGDKEIGTEVLIDMLNDSACGETRALEANATYSCYMIPKLVTEHFRALHGKEAVPLSTIGETVEAEHYGFQGVVVPPVVKKIVESEIGSYETRKSTRSLQPKVCYSYQDLNEMEQKTLIWASNLVQTQVKTFNLNIVSVVDFYSQEVQGTFEQIQGESSSRVHISLARHILNSRAKTLRVLVHELAHTLGGEGTVTHRDLCDEIMSGIIVYLSEVIE